MSLREEIHNAVEQLGDQELEVLRTHIRVMLAKSDAPASSPSSGMPPPDRVPTLDEVLELTSMDPTSWADDIIKAREDRI